MLYPNTELENICYAPDHINNVILHITNNFTKYFTPFLESLGGKGISNAQSKKIASSLGLDLPVNKKQNLTNSFKILTNTIIAGFENETRDNRQSYLNIMDDAALEEYKDDPSLFKNTVLKNECPVIRMTIQNRQAKELDKYRIDFSHSDPGLLLRVVTNLNNFKKSYAKDYDSTTYDNMQTYSNMGLDILDTEDYVAYGVIGGGIKSHMLYMCRPDIFPNRSREAIWALWFLSDKKDFGCIDNSEFIMINSRKNIVQQNFFYPYSLFSFYAFTVYKLLKNKALEYSITLEPTYRYTYVDSFLKYVALQHSEDINVLKDSGGDGNDFY